MSKPSLSVIVPSYNQGRFIRATLESVLSQGYEGVEILVMDGGSKDETVEVLKSYGSRITWVSEPDRGQTDAINKGLGRASGDILCYLNSDDVLFPGSLQAVASCFESEPDTQVLYGHAHHLKEDGSYMEDYYTERWNYQRLLSVCYICQPTVFWRRSVVERYGVFDDMLQFAMDYEYWLRVGKNVPFRYLEGVTLAGSRLYAENKTLSQIVPVHRDILGVARRYTETPYRWMMVLADHMSSAERRENRTTWPFISACLDLSKEFDIPMNAQLANELLQKMRPEMVTLQSKWWRLGRKLGLC